MADIKKTNSQEIEINSGNVDVLTIKLLNDISIKLARLIELQENK